MRKSIQLQTPSALFLLAMLFSFQSALAQTEELEQIKRAIAQHGAQWTAGENWVTKLSPEEQKRLCGAILEPPDPARAKLLALPMIAALPERFDWRNNNGNWVTPVKKQDPPKGCGSCWDFSAVAQVESWWKIHTDNPDSMIDLSEQFILSCGTAGSCNGGSVSMALDFVRATGLPSEACFQYQADDQVPCTSACKNWQDEAVKIPGRGYITLAEPLVERIKNAVYRHPVSAGFDVYSDFLAYSSSVYEHVWGSYVGDHAILIVGWNDAEQSWICKNSTGTGWGECKIGRFIPFIWVETTGDSAFAVSPEWIDLALAIGDTFSQPVTLSNRGAAMLEFSSFDQQSPATAYFHPATFHAFSGFSWWCGDPKISGYDNLWLQYLDLPALDFANATNPKLSFMGYWAMEEPSNVPVPFDGWDGCNVWLSADGGQSFAVAVLNSPAYSCSSLYSFGGVGGAWGVGLGIAGWAGKSRGWSPVELDLSSCKRKRVIVRFAFASDGRYSTLNNPTLYGFFIDDIMVNDGSAVLFENHGDADARMHAHGNIGSGEKANWLTLSPGTGTIAPNTSLLGNLKIDTKSLLAGSHRGVVLFTSNDSTYPPSSPYSGRIQVNLELAAAREPTLIITPDSLRFVADLQHPDTLKFTIANQGLDSLRVESMQLSTGYFHQANVPRLPLVMGINRNCELGIVFEPVDNTTKTDSLILVSNDPRQPLQKVMLQGITIQRATANTIYAIADVSTRGFLATLNAADSGKISLVGPTEINSIRGLAVQRDSGYLFGVVPEINFSTFIKLDAQTGFARKILEIPESDVRAMTFNGDTLWAASYAGKLFKINLQTGEAKLIGQTGISNLSGLAFNPKTKKLWATSASNKRLHILSRSTAQRTWERTCTFATHWIAFDAGGQLFGLFIPGYFSNTNLALLDTAQVASGANDRIIGDTGYQRVSALAMRGDIAVSVRELSNTATPTEYALYQNYPNPFNPTTAIEFALPKASFITLKIYDLLGKEVATLVAEKLPAGKHQRVWEAKGLASGVYLYKLEAGELVQTKKLILLR